MAASGISPSGPIERGRLEIVVDPDAGGIQVAEPEPPFPIAGLKGRLADHDGWIKPDQWRQAVDLVDVCAGIGKAIRADRLGKAIDP